MTSQVRIKYNGEPEVREFLNDIGYDTVTIRNGVKIDMPRNFIISIDKDTHFYAELKFGRNIIGPYME
jgi:hypothetical protein